jgi:hypothetical protein
MEEGVMQARAAVMTSIGLVVLVAGNFPLEAAKPKPDLAATAAFRCDALTPGGCLPPSGPTDDTSDRVRDDGAPYTYFYPATTEGASINANGEFTLRFIPGDPQGARSMSVDFGAPVQAPTCSPATCNPAGPPDFLNVTDGYLRTNVVNSSGAELAGGMLGMTCGLTYESRLLITIPDVGGYWVVRFYADAFPPSTFVKVTRTNRTTWIIDATGQKSVLLWNGESKGRPAGPGQEGTYAMPFLIEVTVPSAPATGCN